MNRPSYLASALILALCAGAAVLAPKVLETTPATGDDAVDPALTELRVVFDQPMDPRAGHSFVGGGQTFPEITGQPKWIDERTIILPIRLKPDHAYWLSVNSDRFQGFKSISGEPATPHEIKFTTRGGAEEKALTPQVNQQAIQQAREALRARYSYRDVHVANWDALFAAAAEGLTACKSRGAFAQRLSTVLAEAKDVHISVGVGDQRFSTHRPQFEPNYNGRLLPTLVPRFKKHTDSVFSGRFDDGVGYLMIASLEATRGADAANIITALRGMADAPAIILDLRPNGGGDERIAQKVAGLFIDERVEYARHVSTPAKDGGFGMAVRMLEPNPEGPKLRQPVALLMGPNNMSSAEAFVLMMRQVPQAKLIGGRTYGSSGNPQPIELANGVTVYLPSWKAMDADGIEFEGKGIAPDVEVETTPQELQTRDPVLDRALQWARPFTAE